MNNPTPKQVVARISFGISLVVFGYWLGNDDMGKAIVLWLGFHAVMLAMVGLLWLLGSMEPNTEAQEQEG